MISALLLSWQNPLIAQEGGVAPAQGSTDLAATGAAWAMLGVIAFVMGLVGILILILHHRAKHPLVHLASTEDLANDLEETPSLQAGIASESWEKSPDWWRSPPNNPSNQSK